MNSDIEEHYRLSMIDSVIISQMQNNNNNNKGKGEQYDNNDQSNTAADRSECLDRSQQKIFRTSNTTLSKFVTANSKRKSSNKSNNKSNNNTGLMRGKSVINATDAAG